MLGLVVLVFFFNMYIVEDPFDYFIFINETKQIIICNQ